jgi:hypothetical protein
LMAGFAWEWLAFGAGVPPEVSEWARSRVVEKLGRVRPGWPVRMWREPSCCGSQVRWCGCAVEPGWVEGEEPPDLPPEGATVAGVFHTGLCDECRERLEG